MSAFTFTAPIVTLDEERAEREALSAEERRRIHADLHGDQIEGNQQLHADADSCQIRDLLHQLQNSLDMIPQKEKQALLDALKRVPQLVESDSNPFLFFRHAHCNLDETALRMAYYWDARMKIFGAERCFLPMTLDGAMADDVDTLAKGIIFETFDDDHGRSVIFMDRIRCTKEVGDRETIARCIWYATHALCQSEAVQQKGSVWLINYRGFDLYKHFDRIMTKKLTWCYLAHPISVKGIHCCKGPGSSVSDLVFPILKHMFGRELRLRACLHSGSTMDMLDEMNKYGLGEKHLDCVFGGLVKNGQAAQTWLHRRRIIEGGGGGMGRLSEAAATNTVVDPTIPRVADTREGLV